MDLHTHSIPSGMDAIRSAPLNRDLLSRSRSTSSVRPPLAVATARGWHGVADALDRVRSAPSILETFDAGEGLVAVVGALSAGASPGASDRAATAARRNLIEAIGARSDAPTAIAATHALARLAGPEAEIEMAVVLEGRDWLAAHAAWGLAEGNPTDALVPLLIRLVQDGRLGGMLAQRTLIRWSLTRPRSIRAMLVASLEDDCEALSRARLVETYGAVRGADGRLASIAMDQAEPTAARAAAIAALGDRPGVGALELARIAASPDGLAHHARLALFDHELAHAHAGERPEPGLRIAQVHLGGRMDLDLAHAGSGSTGGVATLLVQLGEALAADPAISSVTTIGRGTAEDAHMALGRSPEAHAVVPAAMAHHEDASFVGEWPALVAAERAVRRVFARQQPTVVHLRMADVGSLAAARLARQRGLAVVFTLAPDPHALIAEMEQTGELDRTSLGRSDGAAALWFRARLVRRFADAAHQVALFPRPALEERLRTLVGIDIAAAPGRFHVIPEGIDPVRVARARSEIAGLAHSASDLGAGTDHDPTPRVVNELRSAIERLGPARLGRPIVLSVGRLAEIKGMARLVEAFGADSTLPERATLVIVGGDLAGPTEEERAEIERIEVVLMRHPGLDQSVVLLGHRPHDDVLRVLAIAEAGLAGVIGAGGVYACASRKEEFGLAIVEALGSGLPVVAPTAGGPPSYVEPGVTGLLVDTMDVVSLASGIHEALNLATVHGRAEYARRRVAETFSVEAMADALVPVYRAATSASSGRLHLRQPLEPVRAA